MTSRLLAAASVMVPMDSLRFYAVLLAFAVVLSTTTACWMPLALSDGCKAQISGCLSGCPPPPPRHVNPTSPFRETWEGDDRSSCERRCHSICDH